MKTRVILTLCVVFVLAMVANAGAQATLIAGSAEDRAFTAITNEQNLDNKIKLCLDFEKEFQKSKVLPDIYVMLVTAYTDKGDKAKVDEVGEKALKIDPDNFTILMAVSRSYGMQKKDLARANTYAQRAVEVLDQRKAEQKYKDDAAWKAYIDSIATSAKANLTWIKTIH